MSSKSPVISVVVCTFNRADMLADCLRSLVEQSLDKGCYEVIVVDNNSTDNTRDIAESFIKELPNFRLVTEQVQGLAHARNRGWVEARGEYVAYIDDDGRAVPDWLDRIVKSFETVAPKPVAVGGEIHPFYEMSPPAWFTDDFELRTWGSKPGFLHPPKLMIGFSGANMAFQRRVVAAYGGFSSSFGMMGKKFGLGEETDLFFRIHLQEPHFWYDPAIRVYHWTPVRNMKVEYRARRAFRAGRSHAVICGRKWFSRENAAELLHFCITLLGSPLRLVRRNGLRRTAAVKMVQELAYSLGLLCGRG